MTRGSKYILKTFRKESTMNEPFDYLSEIIFIRNRTIGQLNDAEDNLRKAINAVNYYRFKLQMFNDEIKKYESEKKQKQLIKYERNEA